jgi:hypothetical protein
MKTLLKTALTAVLSTAILVGCGGSAPSPEKQAANAQKAAETVVMDFVKAAAQADFDTADKLVFMGDNEVATFWMVMKQQIRDCKKAETEGHLPDNIFMTFDFEAFHHPTLDDIVKTLLANAEGGLAAYGVSDFRMVVLKLTPHAETVKEYGSDKRRLLYTVAVCKDGVWKVIPNILEPLDIELEDLEKMP